MKWDPEAFAEMVVMTIKKALLGPLVAGRIDTLEHRIGALEARPAAGVEYGGTHEVGKAYISGVLVTKQGGLWLALRPTTQTPGMDPASWKLIVKSGHAEDGRQ